MSYQSLKINSQILELHLLVLCDQLIYIPTYKKHMSNFNQEIIIVIVFLITYS